jgi:hypothetical protein
MKERDPEYNSEEAPYSEILIGEIFKIEIR